MELVLVHAVCWCLLMHCTSGLHSDESPYVGHHAVDCPVEIRTSGGTVPGNAALSITVAGIEYREDRVAYNSWLLLDIYPDCIASNTRVLRDSPASTDIKATPRGVVIAGVGLRTTDIPDAVDLALLLLGVEVTAIQPVVSADATFVGFIGKRGYPELGKVKVIPDIFHPVVFHTKAPTCARCNVASLPVITPLSTSGPSISKRTRVMKGKPFICLHGHIYGWQYRVSDHRVGLTLAVFEKGTTPNEYIYKDGTKLVTRTPSHEPLYTCLANSIPISKDYYYGVIYDGAYSAGSTPCGISCVTRTAAVAEEWPTEAGWKTTDEALDETDEINKALGDLTASELDGSSAIQMTQSDYIIYAIYPITNPNFVYTCGCNTDADCTKGGDSNIVCDTSTQKCICYEQYKFDHFHMICVLDFDLALRKSTHQSTTTSPLVASLAVDGSALTPLSCSATEPEASPWWVVDLGSMYYVTTMGISTSRLPDNVDPLPLTITHTATSSGSSLLAFPAPPYDSMPVITYRVMETAGGVVPSAVLDTLTRLGYVSAEVYLEGVPRATSLNITATVTDSMLQDFEIVVGNYFPGHLFPHYFTVCTHYSGNLPLDKLLEVPCRKPTPGQYVGIHMRPKAGIRILRLCDVTVYGRPVKAYGSYCIKDYDCQRLSANMKCDIPNHRCICTSPGYRYNPHIDICVDINECHDPRNTCTASGHLCVNTPGSFTCKCLEIDGQILNSVAGVCINATACGLYDILSYCHGHSYCQVEYGKPVCVCPKGYSGARCSIRTGLLPVDIALIVVVIVIFLVLVIIFCYVVVDRNEIWARIRALAHGKMVYHQQPAPVCTGPNCSLNTTAPVAPVYAVKEPVYIGHKGMDKKAYKAMERKGYKKPRKI